MQWTNIVFAYFVIGAVMWGGGAIAWGDSGVAGLIIEDPQTGDLSTETADNLEGLGGPIREAAATLGGTGLLAVWNIVIKFLSFFFWPIVTLQGAGAPPRIWVMFGGTPTAAFWVTLIRLIRSSA